MVMTAKSKPYCKLGKVLDALARSRDVRGPYNIAFYLKSVTGYEVSGQAVSKYLYGEYMPKRAFIRAFAEAMELTRQERSELAWVYTYGFQPEDNGLTTGERKEPTGTLLGAYRGSLSEKHSE